MKIIDLLVKIANEETVPELIKYNGVIYEWTGLTYYCPSSDTFLEQHICLEDLCYPVEIIEEVEDKEYEDIQKIKNKRFTRNQKQIASKINELIDAVNEMRKYREED